MNDVLQYEGKRVIVTGAASGMGAATAQILVDLGAEVHAIDIKKPEVTGLASFSQCDLRDPAQIDETIGKIGKIVNALFNCAGLPNTFPNLDVMLVNFCGLRQVTESVIPLMIEGSSIASIASTAGIGWMQNMELLFGLMMTPDFAGAARGARRTRRSSRTRTACRRKRSTRTPRFVRSTSRRTGSASTASTPARPTRR